jgi:hypothetical protein
MNRKYLYYSIMAVPALLFLMLAVLFFRDLHALRTIDAAEIYRGLQNHLALREGVSFPLPEETFINDRSKKTVFVFGSSDLILSDGGVFPSYLEQRHSDLRVVNLGVMGIDSFLVRQRVFEALAVAKPDIIVLFLGHNDYNEAYHNSIQPDRFEKFDFLLKLPYVFFYKNKPVSPFATEEYGWFARLHRPRIFNLLQQMGMLTVRDADFEPVNALILDSFIRNNEAILDLAASRGIPVVLATPIGNLHAEPFGDIRTTTALYRKGMAEKDYTRSIGLLREAKDSEIFTYDLRAKSGLIRYLRGLKRPHVYVLDLEKRLEEMQFGFGNADFVDYVHLNDRSHRLLADIVYDFMRRKKLANK